MDVARRGLRSNGNRRIWLGKQVLRYIYFYLYLSIYLSICLPISLRGDLYRMQRCFGFSFMGFRIWDILFWEGS